MQKVMPFTKALASLFSGGLDKTISNLFQGGLDLLLDETAYERLIDMIESPKSKYKKLEIFEAILKYIEKQSEWPKNLRILMVIHKLTHYLGEEVLQIIGTKRAAKLIEYKPPKPNTAKCGLLTLIPLYFSYLHKLNCNHLELDICFYYQYEIDEPLPENIMPLLHFLQRVQNTIKELFKILLILEKELLDANPSKLVKETAYFFLTDSFHYYSYTDHMIRQCLPNIFTLSDDETLLLCEIYCEHIQITKKLKNFFDMKNLLHEFFLHLPEFYHLDCELNHKIELHANEVRLRHPKKSTKTSIGSIGIDSDHSGVSPPLKGSSDDKHTSLNEFSSAKTPKRRCSLLGGEKSLFKPPRAFLRKKNPFSEPKIKIIKPRNKVDEKAKTLLLIGHTDNKNLLQVPEDRHGEPDDNNTPIVARTNKPVSLTTLPVTLEQKNTLKLPEINPYGLKIPGSKNGGSPMNCRAIESFGSTRALSATRPENLSISRLH